MNESTGDVHNLVQVGHARDINVSMPPTPMTALRGMPPSTPSFAGRTTELDQLAAAPFAVISGMGGVGKTGLALRFAEGFAGDRLFYDLRGYGEHPHTAGDALKKFLVDLGVRECDIPAGEDNRESLFRTLVADREPMLIVLDNASSSSQVRRLLVPEHRMVVISRHRLTGLDGAHHLALGVLPTEDAITLVGDVELASLCGNLPLALQIMAALRRADPNNDWAGELREARLNVLRHDDQDVRAAFDLSYRALSVEQRRFFRLIGMHHSEQISEESCAAFAGVSVAEARTRLRELRSAHLLEQNNQFHDLVQDFADERRNEESPVPEVIAAGERYIQHAGYGSPGWSYIAWGVISTWGPVDAIARVEAVRPYRDRIPEATFELLAMIRDMLEGKPPAQDPHLRLDP